MKIKPIILAVAVAALFCSSYSFAKGGNQSKATCIHNGVEYKYKCQENGSWDSKLWCDTNDDGDIRCQQLHDGSDNCKKDGEVFQPSKGPYEYLDPDECTYKK